MAADNPPSAGPMGVGPLACDCHSHIYGPYALYPLPAGHGSPPEKTPAQYEALLSRLGIDRSVFVQPLAYGTDHRAMLAAMAAKSQDRARGVAIIEPNTERRVLRELSAAGVKGVRIMTTEPGASSLQEAPLIARLVEPLGWHLQIQGDGGELENWAPIFRALPTTVVIDHVGRLPVGGGTDSPAFKALLKLLESGNVWVKLSAFYYGFTDGRDDAEIALRVRTLAAERLDRLVWGLNWPHPRYPENQKPDDVGMFRAFLSWLPDADIRKAILVDNPARLYGFP